MTSRFASFSEQDIKKVVEDKNSQTQNVDEGGKGAVW